MLICSLSYCGKDNNPSWDKGRNRQYATKVGFILKEYHFGEVLCLWNTSIVILKADLVFAKTFVIQNTLSEFPKIMNQLQIEAVDVWWLLMLYIELYLWSITILSLTFVVLCLLFFSFIDLGPIWIHLWLISHTP